MADTLQFCAYTTFGDLADYPIFCLHAFPLKGSMLYSVAQQLSLEGYYVIVPDLRGFGASPISPEPVEMAQMADDILSIADECQLDRFAIAGLSMGGYVALALWKSAPARCSHLLLIDTRAGADTEKGRQSREDTAQIALVNGVDAVAQQMIPRLLSEFTVQHNPATVAAVRAMINGNTPYGIASASRGMALRPDSTPLLPEIDIPTLVCVGEQDIITNIEEAQHMAQAIPQAQLTVIPKAGHLTAIDAPATLTVAMASFMRNTKQ